MVQLTLVKETLDQSVPGGNAAQPDHGDEPGRPCQRARFAATNGKEEAPWSTWRNQSPALGPAKGFSHATRAIGLVWLGGQVGADSRDLFSIRATWLPRAALLPIGNAYREVFGHHYPASVLVGVTSRFDPDDKVEIECVALGPEERL